MQNLHSKYNLRTRFFFKNLYGDPFTLTPGQEEIFKSIYEPIIKRATIKTITQYGKSEVASIALIMAAIERMEKIIIVSPSIKQSTIIMNKLIEHLFDHKSILQMIEYEYTLEQLKRERSKDRITFRNGSEIRILTAEAKSVAREAKSLMGFGATIVLVDESALIPDQMFSKILRMVGGVRNGKLIKLGNPFLDPVTGEKNHFAKSFNDPNYYKVHVDWRQALAEGRISQEFLDEAKNYVSELDWIVFYECMFPEMGTHDMLIPLSWVENATKDQRHDKEGVKQAGLDIARFGGDKTVYCFRWGNKVYPLQMTEKMDTMQVVGWARQFIDEDKPDTIVPDVVGLGAGVADRFREQGYEVYDMNVGASPSDDTAKEKFVNLRAEVFWFLRELLRPDPATGLSKIQIPNDAELKKDLTSLKYAYSSERKIKIESKDDLRKRIGRSPDRADALALACYDLTVMQPEFIIY